MSVKKAPKTEIIKFRCTLNTKYLILGNAQIHGFKDISKFLRTIGVFGTLKTKEKE